MKKRQMIVVFACILAIVLLVLTGCKPEDTVQSITLKSAPTKTTYNYGEALDITGAKIEVIMTGGTKNEVNVTAEMVSGYDANKVGEQTITVTYEGVKMSFKVTVKPEETEDTIESVTLKSAPTKTEYNYGEELDLTGAKIEVTMTSGTKNEVDVTAAMVSGYNANQEGEQTITVTYEGVNMSFKVTVKPEEIVVDTIESVTLKSAPTKTEYNYGEALNLAGAKIEVTMTSGAKNEIDVTAEMVSGYDANKVGEQTITVTYEGVNLSFKVTVNPEEVEDTIESVTLKSAPTKTEYNYGEELDLAGAKIEVTMTSGTKNEVDVTAAMVSGYNAQTLGEQTIAVTYQSVNMSFKVTVSDVVDDITLLSSPTKTLYNYGENLDVTGAKIAVDMLSGAYSEIDVTEDMVTGYDALQVGEQRITVTYSSLKVMFTVTVTRDPIYVLPEDAKYAADLPLLIVGEQMEISLRGDATMTSGNTDVATIDGNTVTAVAFGSAIITVSDETETKTLTLIVKKDYSGLKVTTQSQLSTTKQGVNDLYVYRMDNGDIEDNLESNLQNIVLYEEGGGSWWNTISFIGTDHFGGRGTGAIAFRASTAGNYTVDYSAWIEDFIRHNVPTSGYLDADETDGYTTGIAKRNSDGTITVILSNIGTKMSVIEDATRYHMGTYTTDLVKGEELIVFFCSNGFAHSDEVYTDINFITNSTVKTELLVMPELNTAEGLPMTTIGQEVVLTIRDGATVTSSNTDVATIDGNTINAVGYGTTVITVSESDEERSFTLVVKRDYTGLKVTPQSAMSTTTQGVNNLYIYRMDNGDIENDLQNGLQGLVLHNENTNWWDGITFVGNDHFGGRGTGAIAFRASTAGNYTVDYSAWMLAQLHNGYLNSEVVDGFTTGIAKRNADGTITVILSNIGTRNSVIEDATRYHMGTYTADLERGEELLVFFCSNGNPDCDEVFTDINFITNSTVKAELLVMPELNKVEELSMTTIGQQIALTIRDGATVASSNTNVATIDGNKVNAVGYGTTVITVSEADESKSFVLVVKRNYDGLDVTTQSQLSTTTQGVNNMYVYRMDNGDIENDLENSLQNLELYAQGDAWWNGTSFIGTDHFGGSGTGAIAYRASVEGSYTVDYSAWLLQSLRKDGAYASWDIDGFTTGIARKNADGTITLITSNIGTKSSVVEDETRYQMGSYTTNLEVGEELIVFFCSNGNGACDEVFTDINFVKNA